MNKNNYVLYGNVSGTQVQKFFRKALVTFYTLTLYNTSKYTRALYTLTLNNISKCTRALYTLTLNKENLHSDLK
jgi:hypothetical protein